MTMKGVPGNEGTPFIRLSISPIIHIAGLSSRTY